MVKVFKKLKPEIVWRYFEDICNIPRPSKNEEKIIEYLIDFGKKHNLETKKDTAGNILISKAATANKANLKSVVLQSHVDMVCEKNSDIEHDFLKDPIKPFIDKDWVKAEGTTLGGDDGIGVATQLAILASKNIEHGPIECLFTVDEETGLTGANSLEPEFFKSNILINLDSEDEGEICIGCAGGIDTVAVLKYEKKDIPKDSVKKIIKVSGLKGGHSGDDIHRGLGNSIKILNRLLWEGINKYNIRIACFEGGNLRNAIPRESFAVVLIPNKSCNCFEEYFNKFTIDVKNELSVTEPNLTINIEDFQSNIKNVMSKKSQLNFLQAVYSCPNGVFAWSKKMKGLVETSTNLASIKFDKKNKIIITTSQRSSVDSSKYDISRMVESVFELSGAKVTHSEGYPGWNPNTKSEILQIAKDSYIKLYEKKPRIRAIHAGLECGLFLAKYPALEMISIGPTIKEVHSPSERLNIKSVQKYWDFLLDILKNIPAL